MPNRLRSTSCSRWLPGPGQQYRSSSQLCQPLRHGLRGLQGRRRRVLVTETWVSVSMSCGAASMSEWSANPPVAAVHAARRGHGLFRNAEEDPATRPGVHVVMGLRDVRQRIHTGDTYLEIPGPAGRREIAGGLLPGFSREVVTANKAQRDVREQERPERDLRPLFAGCVRCDD